jgi:hypothetical protein
MQHGFERFLLTGTTGALPVRRGRIAYWMPLSLDRPVSIA